MSKSSAPKIPLVKPWLPFSDAYREAVSDIVERRFVSNWSKYCALLEDEAKSILQNEHTMAVSSCDIGLILAWRVLGLRGGEVITPSFTFCSTTNALLWNGLTPVFADIDPQSFCLDPDSVASLITEKTVGITATHTFGRAAPIAQLEALAHAHGLALVFDAAHAVGTTYSGASVGKAGDVSVFSLSGTKIVTAGEGGLITLNSASEAQRLVALRSYGFVGDYNCTDIGLNGKMSEANAAMGWLSMRLVAEAVARRNELAARYRGNLTDLPLTFQQTPDGGDVHGYTYFSVLLDTVALREAVQRFLTDAAIETKRYFLPVHGMDAYRQFKDADVPVTHDVYSRILCLPLFHEMTDADLDRVCTAVRAAVARVS